MSKIWPILFLIACITLLASCLFYGLVILTFPLIFLLWFSIFFLAFAIRSSVQASANPGLEELEEPDYWFSAIYEAWLYVTDRKGWAIHVCFWSYIIGALISLMFGGLVFFVWKTSFAVSLASWLSGMFLMLSIASLIANSDHWSKTTEYGDTSYEVIQPLLE